jgi:hypothetical protein
MNTIKAVCAGSLLTLAFGLAVNGYSQSFLTTGLVAYYPFNGNANDASGNGWNGTPENSNGIPVLVPYSQGNLGVLGSAIDLSGGNFIDLGLSLPPSVPTGLSQSFWVKSTQQLVPSDVTGQVERIIFLTRRAGVSLDADEVGGGGWPTICINAEGNLAVWVDDYFYGNENQITNVPANQVLDGRWHQVVGVKDGTNYSLFLDGSVVGQFSDSHQFTDSDGTRHVWLGRNWGIYPQPLEFANCSAALCNVRLYNRALATNEVAQLYAIESAPVVTFVKAFTLDYSGLIIGSNYQAQASSDLVNWTNWGSPFTATSSTYTNSHYQRIANWNQLFFRLQLQ